MCKFLVICGQLLLFSVHVHAQNFVDKTHYLIDSLQVETLLNKERDLLESALETYHETSNDSIRISAIYNFIDGSENIAVWSKYNQWLLSLFKSRNYNNPYQKALVFAKQGKYENKIGHYERAINYYKQSLELSETLGEVKQVATTCDVLGNVYKKKGDFQNALASYKRSLSLRKSIGDRKKEGSILNTIGFLHLSFGMHSKALDYFHASLKVREEIDDERGMTFCYNNIASVYMKQGRSDVALEYYFKSLKIREKLGFKSGVSILLNNIGVVYKNEKEFDKALEYYQKSLAIKQELNSQRGIAHTLNNIGTIYNKQNKLAMALVNYEESLKMSTALHDEKWMAITLFNMGSVYLKQNNLAFAYDNALRSLKMSQNIGQPELIKDAAEVLKEVYSAQKSWKAAFQMQDLHITMRDSIRNKQTEADARAYEVQKKEQEIKLLSVKNEVLQREKELQQLKINKNKIVNTVFLIAGLIAFVLAVFFYIVLKKSKALNKLLHKQDAEKKVMLKEIHHRVKNNLQVVNSLLRLQSKEIKDEEVVAKFKETQKRIITIASLHEKMYRSENLKYVNLKDHTASIVKDLIATYALHKNITSSIKVDDVKIGLQTLVPLGLIINEIIINSLKYAFTNRKEGLITLQIKKVDSKRFEMLIGDDGIGLMNRQQVTGLGTKLIKIFTKQLNGKLEVLDKPGTVYRIVFEKIDP